MQKQFSEIGKTSRNVPDRNPITDLAKTLANNLSVTLTSNNLKRQVDDLYNNYLKFPKPSNCVTGDKSKILKIKLDL